MGKPAPDGTGRIAPDVEMADFAGFKYASVASLAGYEWPVRGDSNIGPLLR